mmetsp:Transcript_12477/g.25335  ORF Transcript_12477/g.25335 Transcript_12477/m.25335 type:complete len:306 (-) Transcript_12477:649-1566(-)
MSQPLRLRRSEMIRSAVCMAFSWGSFFVPGSWFMSTFPRPSGNCSLIFTRNFVPALVLQVMRSNTTSTTRAIASFLCCVASCMMRAEPPWISWANSWKVLAWPVPNLLTSTAWSSSIFLSSSWLDSSPLSSLKSAALLKSISTFSLLAFAASHHSNDVTFSVCRSFTEKAGFDLRSVSATPSTGFWLASSSRSMSSRRRSAMPALAPVSLTSGLKSMSSFCFSFSCWPWALWLATKGCLEAASALRRSDSLRSRILFSSSPHSLELRGGITTFFAFTSSSPLKGKRPVTRPYITTPMAQTSTFRP